MSLVEHMKSAKDGAAKAPKGSELRRDAFARLADRLGIKSDARADAEKELRLYLEVLRDEDDSED